MSTVATRTHSIELTLAHASTLGRMVNGAFQVSVTRFGEVEILARHDAVGVDFAESLGLTPNEREGHSNDRSIFHVWTGTTSSAFGSFATRVTIVEPVPQVEFPADCYSAELT